ncbi:MAG: hypothetical protein JOZ10_19385 [Acidobacteria bacterium]|nr:hypothetical protein [Acidobacteriota bacterium]MBV9436269.1 hypothetical protein [Acidobacteriota bacterium]
MQEKDNIICLLQGTVSGTWMCSICAEEFHVSPIGPLKSVTVFSEHVKVKHPESKLARPMFRTREAQ